MNTVTNRNVLKESKDWHTSLYRKQAQEREERRVKNRQVASEFVLFAIIVGVIIWTWWH